MDNEGNGQGGEQSNEQGGQSVLASLVKEPHKEPSYITPRKVVAPDKTTFVKDPLVEAKAQANAELRRSMRRTLEEPTREVKDEVTGEVTLDTKANADAREFTEKFKRGRKRRRWILVGVLAVLSIVLVANYIRGHRTLAGIPKPIQKDIKQAILDGDTTETEHSFEVKGGRVELTYLATYDIKGLVVYVDDYDNLWANLFRTEFEGMEVAERAMPRDISLAWGSVAKNANGFKWGHGYRDLIIHFKSDGPRTLQDRDGDDEVSNNHIIIEPDSELRKKVMKVKNRDYIEIKGYLVEGSFIDDRGYVETFRSSLVRNDDGGTAFNRKTSCEIIYITDLEWLD